MKPQRAAQSLLSGSFGRVRETSDNMVRVHLATVAAVDTLVDNVAPDRPSDLGVAGECSKDKESLLQRQELQEAHIA